MAWTTPRTWATGELVTASIMNTHVRDNLNAVPHLQVRKPSDESRTSNITFSNDADLQLSVEANGVYHVEFGVLFSGSTSGNIKIQFTFPAGGTIGLSTPQIDAAGSTGFARFFGSTSPSSSNNFICLGSNGRTYLPIRGVYVNGGTAGTLIMQWAQNASNATPTNIHANSTVWAVKLA